MMEPIEFTYNADDFVAFNLYARWRKVPTGKLRSFNPSAFWLIGVFFFVAVLLVADSLNMNPVFQWPLLGIGGIAMLVLWLMDFEKRAMVYQVRRSFAKGAYQGHLDKKRLWLTPEGYNMASEQGSGVTHWSAVQSIDAAGDYLFIRCTADTVVIVPGRAFPDRAALEAFAEKMREYKRAAAPS